MSFWQSSLSFEHINPTRNIAKYELDSLVKHAKLAETAGTHFPWTHTSFEYILNEYGFRDPSPHVEADFKILVSGCSFTFGDGLPYEMTWPYLLQEKLRVYHPSISHFNLAMSGASNDYIVRSICKVIDIYKPDLVAVLWTFAERAEVFTNDQLYAFSAMNQNSYKEVLKRSDDSRVQRNNLKSNVVMLNEICSAYDTKLVHGKILIESVISPPDIARDYNHPGPSYHEKIASIFEKLPTAICKIPTPELKMLAS